MFVSRQITNAVCFVCEGADGKYIPRGTAFFMGIPIPGDPGGRLMGVVVTALHVIWKIEEKQHQIFLRVNTQDGGFDYVEMPFSEWSRPDHSDGIVDAAACYFPHDNIQKFDFKFFGEEHIATSELMAAEDIGIGDEVYLAGLFVSHAGQGRNEPIVRSGTIAAMPAEEVLTTQGYMRAYLIESRSVGGLSGSPVFVDVSLYRQDSNGRIQLRGSNQTAWYLIGLIRGHWDATDSLPFRSDYSSETDFNVPAEDGAMDERDERVNMGIAIVTPIERVLPLIHDAAQRMATAQDAISDLSADEKARAVPNGLLTERIEKIEDARAREATQRTFDELQRRSYER
ncbi:hypothetical protein [Mycolicibacterium elephantis]|uniref:hypothetical protein n=1 Tax=Mycolicibacterium elephantis TaxID=81858 RepID=UPI00104220AE|nr:hypothetical protein [Mycolicibacterium elephantis]